MFVIRCEAIRGPLDEAALTFTDAEEVRDECLVSRVL